MVRFAAAAIALVVTGFGFSARADDLVLLDFWSPTCGPCMQMKPVVQGLVNAGYPIRQIDASRDRKLVEQHRVTHLPCFILLSGGQEVERIVGATSSERLAQMFQRGRGQSPDRVPVSPASAPTSTPSPMTATGPAPPTPEPSWPPQDGANGIGNQPASVANGENFVPVDAPTGAGVPHETPTNLLAATVRLRVEDAKGHSFGTGTIIDARQGEALLITCGHIFRESQGKGEVMVDLFEVTPQGVRMAGKVPGKVISYDLERDVALVSIKPNRPVTVAPVALPQAVLQRGDRVASIGCSNGEDPTILATRINSLDRYQGPPNIEAGGAPVEGRSGGGLFNLQGELVGVCFAADYEGNEGLYTALESIHGELDRLGLKEIYEKAPAESLAAAPSVVRGQEPAAVEAPVGELKLPDPAASLATITEQPGAPELSQRLSSAEQATLEEIAKRAATHEVVCIIRPREPGAQSEVIHLEAVSPEFIRALPASRPDPQAPIVR